MKSKIKLSYIEYAFFVTVILGAITVTGISTYRHINPKSITSALAKPRLNLNQMAASLNNNLKNKFPALSSKSYDQTLKFGYQFPGENFQIILPPTLNSFTYADNQTTNESSTYSFFARTLPYINSYLKQQGFGAPVDQTPAGTLLTTIYFYKSSKNICQVAIYTLLDINCAPLEDLHNAEESAKPFIKLYEAAYPHNGQNAVSYPQIQTSQTPGYRIAVDDFYNNAGETSANFWQQGTGDWHMVPKLWYSDHSVNGNVMRNCSYFDSSSQTSAAFKGQTCWNWYQARPSIIL